MMKLLVNEHTNWFQKKCYVMEPFMELYSILGQAWEDEDIAMSWQSYENSLFLLPFNVLPTSWNLI